ncbi:hypothetical protein CROQUDRAFT_658927 [Cronartium quercuum f. sp. fusiforme G11]|uniref:Uncharacterized protein n=1 Tax=Cronartium quercuum f. sp. fusiforme G11 TaxID=708437 RepID=A0A9P6NED0_9BASI|nr:hypothetical protein CROQUDRAFT_658927 [Cronartium quercuum f. sp. fusiforme G11]
MSAGKPSTDSFSISSSTPSSTSTSSGSPRRISSDSFGTVSSSSSSSSDHSRSSGEYDALTDTAFFSFQRSTNLSDITTIPRKTRKPKPKQIGWILDHTVTYDLDLMHQNLSNLDQLQFDQNNWEQTDYEDRAGVWRPIKPAPLPLLQHEPSQFDIKLTEREEFYEIKVWLPTFQTDSILVSQNEDKSIYIVADQLIGQNQGHFERLFSFHHSSLKDDHFNHSPSRLVSSNFNNSNQILLVKIFKTFTVNNTGRAVVCDNGSGLTGNKTYRLLL